MEKKINATEYGRILVQNGISKLYHFTDRDNLDSIIKNGGLYSWADCETKGIVVEKPGGGQNQHDIDKYRGLQDYVNLCFTRIHPMMYIAMNEGRISNPVVLEIDPQVVEWNDSLFVDKDIARTDAHVGGDLDVLKGVHFRSLGTKNFLNLSELEQQYYQAGVLVKHFIPLEYITNIADFGVSVLNRFRSIQVKEAYTAQISRSNPTAFVFLIDQSASMQRMTSLFGTPMTMADALVKIVNRQIKELVNRCIKGNEIRNYYDIAVLGYGEDVYSAWQGTLSEKLFATPDEIMNNPYQRIITQKLVRTRNGSLYKDVEDTIWITPRADGRQTRMDIAFAKVKAMLDEWVLNHKDSYPPTVIHITDGEVVGASDTYVMRLVNEIKSQYTADGNVLLFNIHITPANESMSLTFPSERVLVAGNHTSAMLFDMSSLLPLRYNEEIKRMKKDIGDVRHVAMAVNATMEQLIQLMDVGTPTNISRQKK